MPCRCPPKSKEAGRTSNSVDLQRSCETNSRSPDVCSLRCRRTSLRYLLRHRTARLCLTLGRSSVCHQRAQSLTRIGRCDWAAVAILVIFLASHHQVGGETVACERTAPFAVENHTEKVACIHDPWLQTRLLKSNPYILDSGK